mmetsp:Transcript_15489/g.18436  ORF Transcript_15489/g.18436 Transcript_15489/m.18436 type:complete len:95 (-) Transcript_15489:19-303(-)
MLRDACTPNKEEKNRILNVFQAKRARILTEMNKLLRLEDLGHYKAKFDNLFDLILCNLEEEQQCDLLNHLGWRTKNQERPTPKGDGSRKSDAKF